MVKLKRSDWCIATVLFGLTLAWQAWHIMRVEIWYDEAYSALGTVGGWANTWQVILAQAQPPLHYLALKLWSVIFGSSFESLRMESAVWGSLVPATIYLWLRSRRPAGARWVAGVAAGLLLLNPFLTQYGQEMRYCSQTTALVVIAAALIYNFVEDDYRGRRWWLAGCLLALGWLTNYAAILAIGPIAIWLRFTIRRQWSPQDQRRIWFALLTPIVVGSLLFLEPIARSIMGGAQFIVWVPPLRADFLPMTIWSFLVGVQRHAAGFTPPVFGLNSTAPTLVLLVLLFLGVRAMLGQRQPSDRLLNYITWLWTGTLVTAVIFSFVVTPLWLPRYIMPAAVWLIVWLVLIAHRLATKQRLLAGLLLICVLALGFARPEPVDNHLEDIAHYAQANSGTYVVMSPYDLTMLCFQLRLVAGESLSMDTSGYSCQVGSVTVRYSLALKDLQDTDYVLVPYGQEAVLPDSRSIVRTWPQGRLYR